MMTGILTSVELGHYGILAAVLFCIGLSGSFLGKRDISRLMSLMLMLNAVCLLLAVFSVQHSDAAGQAMVVLIMLTGVIELAAGFIIITKAGEGKEEESAKNNLHS